MSTTLPVPTAASAGGSSSSAPAVLHRAPAALALPSADPRGLAVETMLRIAQTRYTKRDAHYRDLALAVPKDATGNGGKKAPPAQYATARGVEAAMKGLGSALDTDVIANDQRPVATCVETLTSKCLFPAFVFLTLYDCSLYQYGIKKSVTPKVGTLWEGIRGTFRMNALRENPYFYGDANAGAAPPSGSAPSLTQVRVMESVLDEVTQALKSLELLHVAHARANESFFLGTARPCSVDAYAYAGVSAFLHADFASAGIPSAATSDLVLSPIMARFQKKMRDECPLLVKYVEKVRVLLYEDYSSTYHLKPAVLAEAIESTAALQAAHDLYAKGRLRTLLLTGGFAFAYFLVVNADLLAAIAEELVDQLEEEEEEEEDEVARGQAQERRAVEQDHIQEPRE